MSWVGRSHVLGFTLAVMGLAVLSARAAAQLFDFPDWYTLANAAQNGKDDEIAYLLRRGDNPNFVDPRGHTPLSYVAALGDVDGVKMLVSGGARVDYRDTAGDTALHSAAEHGHADVVRLLLQLKASPDLSDHQGVTPLMLAAGANKADVVRLLIAAGADPTRQDYTGRDAASWGKGKPNILQALAASRTH